MLETGCAYCTTPKLHGVNAFKTCPAAGGKPCSPCEQIIILDPLITKAKEELSELLNRRGKLLQAANYIHEPIIHRLPPEVSSYIFELYLQEHRGKKQTSSRTITPLSLGAVCRTWRNITWGSPYLWTHISINLNSVLQGSTSYLATARNWLNRAGQLPVTIHIYLRRNIYQDIVFEEISDLATLINGHLSHCRNLEIDCPSYLVPYLDADAPILQKMRITSDVEPHTFRRDTEKIYFGIVPLHGIDVSMVKFPLKWVTMDWEAVTHLEGTCTSPEECFWILDNVPQLVRCVWDCSLFHVDASTVFLSRRMVNTTIKSFKLEANSNIMQLLLNALTLPTLTHLEIDPKQTVLPHAAIISFLPRSALHLTSLTLSNIRGQGEDIISVLKAAPSVRELFIFNDGIMDCDPDVLFPFFGETSVHHQNPEQFLPNLELLTIKFRADTGFTWTWIPKIFESTIHMNDPYTRAGRRPLNTLRIIHEWTCANHWRLSNPASSGIVERLSNDIDENVTRQLLRIAEAGVKLDIQDAYYEVDLLKESMERHSIELPVWYSDKNHYGRVSEENNQIYELLYTGSEISAEETDPDLEETDEDNSLNSDGGSDDDIASNASDLSYDSHDDITAYVSGETVQMMFNLVEIETD